MVLDELLASADVVSIHLSKSLATEGLIDARQLKDGAILYQHRAWRDRTWRCLIDELKAGRISAGLDVYVNEPHVPAELLQLENVVVLPHLGSATREARQAMWNLAWTNLLLGIIISASH
ncbi:MAG: NAD(P)-dependent oxidoreductase [Gemmatimonadota bacterium]